MQKAFSFSNSPWVVRSDLGDCFRFTWDKLALAGNWLTGDERVAVARAVRTAMACELCARRKAALSPFAEEGAHDGEHGVLTSIQVDAVHRLVTDPSRLTRAWLADVEAGGLQIEVYVEILSIVVAVMAIDAFHRALGFELEPLPTPIPGEPSGYRPDAAETSDSWVPMVPLARVAPEDADMYAGMGRSANVISAMSVVPDGVRLLRTQSAAMYLEVTDVANPATNGGRALTRPQIELLAGRVSAMNDCFY